MAVKDWERNQFHGPYEVFEINDPCHRFTHRFQSTSGFVFADATGEHLRDDQASRAMQRITRRVGMRRIGWHTLRHTFATDMASAGVPLHVLRDLLGHSTIEMTTRYAHFSPLMREASVQALERSRARSKSLDFGQPVVNRSSDHVETSDLLVAA